MRKKKIYSFPLRFRASANPGGQYGDYYYERFFVDNLDADGKAKRIFLPSGIKDNPHLDADAYRESLAELDPITREQLENGNWEIRPSGDLFDKTWLIAINHNDIPKGVRWVRFWDLAAIDPRYKRNKHNRTAPDWSVGFKLGMLNGCYYIGDIIKVQKAPHDLEELIYNTAVADGYSCAIRMEEEGGSSGIANTERYARNILQGFDFAGVKPVVSKIERARPVAAACQAGSVFISNHCRNLVDFYAQLDAFPNGSNDDMVDGFSGAFSFFRPKMGKFDPPSVRRMECAVVGGCLYIIETLVRRANWRVEPASQEAGDVEAASFLESCMHDMNGQTWDDFICDVLSMLTYGFSFHEIVYKTRRGPTERDPKFRSQFTDGRIGWQQLPIRSQASLQEWDIDQDTGEILGFIQDPGQVGLNAKAVTIPIEGNLLFKTKASRGNPEGWSLLRRAYRSWYFKRYIEELEGIGIERSLAGIPVLAPPPDVPLFDKDNEEMVAMLNWCQELVDGLRQDRNHGVIIPSTDWQLKLLGAEGSAKALDTDKIIRRHEYRIASSMLSDLILIGGDSAGSFALAETKQSMLLSSLQAIIGSIAATLNSQAS